VTWAESDAHAATGSEPSSQAPPSAPRSDTRETDELRRELDAARQRESELRALLADAHVQLAQRDEELVRSALARRRVEAMEQTRAWRLATRYWVTRDTVRGWLGKLRRWRRP
jgi:hypothetical protein